MAGWILGWGTTDTEESQIRRHNYQFCSEFRLGGESTSLTPSCSRINCNNFFRSSMLKRQITEYMGLCHITFTSHHPSTRNLPGCLHLTTCWQTFQLSRVPGGQMSTASFPLAHEIFGTTSYFARLWATVYPGHSLLSAPYLPSTVWMNSCLLDELYLVHSPESIPPYPDSHYNTAVQQKVDNKFTWQIEFIGSYHKHYSLCLEHYTI